LAGLLRKNFLEYTSYIVKGDNFMSVSDRQVPFFAHFLESQLCEDLSEEQMQSISGGEDISWTMTNPFPSDTDSNEQITNNYSYYEDKKYEKYPANVSQGTNPVPTDPFFILIPQFIF
jgi:Serine endopeptidase inhibitors